MINYDDYYDDDYCDDYDDLVLLPSLACLSASQEKSVFILFLFNSFSGPINLTHYHSFPRVGDKSLCRG